MQRMDRNTVVVIAAVVFLGIALRLYFLRQDNITTYEFSVMLTAESDLSKIGSHSAIMGHHPLYYYFLHGWLRLWGTTERAGKMFSLICGTLLVLAVSWSACFQDGILDKKSALIASFLIAISPIHIFFSHYISKYAFFTLIAFLSNLFFVLSVRNDKLRYTVGYVVFTVLMLYTQICGYIMFLIQAFFFVFIGGKAKRWLVVSFLVIILYLPWHLFFFPQQIHAWQSGSPGMKAAVRYDPPVPTPQTLLQTLLDYSAGNPSLLFLFLFVVLYGVIKNRRDLSSSLFFIFWSAFPILVLYFVSHYIDSVYKYKELLFVSVPLFILVGRGIVCYNRVMKTAIIIVIVITSFLQLASHSYRQSTEPWRELASEISKIRKPSDLVLSFKLQEPFLHYYKDKCYIVNSINSLKVALAAAKGIDRLFFIVRFDEPSVNNEVIDYLKGNYTLFLQQEYTYNKSQYGESCVIAYYLFGKEKKVSLNQ